MKIGNYIFEQENAGRALGRGMAEGMMTSSSVGRHSQAGGIGGGIDGAMSGGASLMGLGASYGYLSSTAIGSALGMPAVGGAIGGAALGLGVGAVGGLALGAIGGTAARFASDVGGGLGAMSSSLSNADVYSFSGLYAGSEGLQSYMNGDYNFQLMCNLPKYRDMVQLDIALTQRGIVVNEYEKLPLSTKDIDRTKNSKFIVLQASPVHIKTNNDRAANQLKQMLANGCRFWKSSEYIGDTANLTNG